MHAWTLFHIQEAVSVQRAAKAAAMAECKAGGGSRGWFQLEEEELQQRRSFVERNSTWQMMQLSCPCPAPSPTHHLINTTSTTKTCWDLNILVAPSCRENGHAFKHSNAVTGEEEDGCVESQTLELFPLRSGDESENRLEKGTNVSAADIDANLTPYQFYEFLPLKN